ncbi:hypothetical protein N9K52_02380 [Litoricolaceae bacterium]|nr:hypothetical protein [Litorivicinaceae bacterium]
MPKTRNRPPVKNKKQINDLKPETEAYRVTVEGVDCLYVTVTPAGMKKYVTSTAVSKRIQLPKGQSRQKSKTHGLTSQFTLPEIKRIHYKYYESFKRGEDLRDEAIRDISDLERTSLLNRPIIELSYELIERKLRRGEIGPNSAYNDQLYTKKLEQVISKISFQEFSQTHADQLATAYPPTEQWSTADKIKKQITKVYNALPSDARIDLRKDVLHYLDNAFGRIKQKTREHLVIAPLDVGDAWRRMLEADVNPIFKDAWVLMLLTGERKEAILTSKITDVRYEHNLPDRWFFNSKGDKDGKGANLVPVYGVLRLLLDRLINAARDKGSDYILPTQKGTIGSLTSINELIDSIGTLGVNEVRSNPHNLRRTVANLARDLVGSTAIADEHLLHSKAHMKGSMANYFSPNAESFAEVRTDTYAKIYRHLDDLVLWSCPILRIEHGEMPELDVQETEGMLLSRDFIAIGKMSVPINRGESKQAVGLFCNHNDFEDHAKIYSPVASFCAGEEKFIHVKNRPLFYQKLIDHWANFGKAKVPNVQNEID